MSDWLIPGYRLRAGSRLDRALLLKFMHRTYQELYPNRNFNHLADTIEQYFSNQTPLWWVEVAGQESSSQATAYFSPLRTLSPVACLWMGNAVDQVQGVRIAHIFLVYVHRDHRRRGIGSALMTHAENWAKQRGDQQISLQVFSHNQPALNLYRKLGYQTQSLSMLKSLFDEEV
ncbi:MAG: GNAT family N-acetyltransferase [Lyngbya sp.]|nr:GNAT family N-acetyltransferase [Lyngbya sp.]